jgi:LacI family transcriptional regulator
VVSAVLRNDSSKVRYSDEVKVRVEEAARRLNYRPDVGARNMRSRCTRTLGLLLSHPQAIPYVPGLIYTGITRRAAQLGYYVSLLHDPAHAEGDAAYSLPRSFRELAVDGYVMLHTGMTSGVIEKALKQSGLPYVYLNDLRSSNAVRPDDVEAGRLATRHAFEAGYRRPAFLAPGAGMQEHFSVAHRQEGFTSVLAERGASGQRHVGPGSEMAADWERFLREKVFVCPAASRPDCLLCASDQLAILVSHGLTRLGLRIPQDVGVVGFNDETLNLLAPTPLTSVRIPWLELAETAVAELVRLVETPGARTIKPRVLPVALTPRASTARKS